MNILGLGSSKGQKTAKKGPTSKNFIVFFWTLCMIIIKEALFSAIVQKASTGLKATLRGQCCIEPYAGSSLRPSSGRSLQYYYKKGLIIIPFHFLAAQLNMMTKFSTFTVL